LLDEIIFSELFYLEYDRLEL